MADSVYDYAVAYPFLPDGLGSSASLFSHIKDARVFFELPAADNVRDVQNAGSVDTLAKNIMRFDARLTQIESGSATFVLSILQRDVETMQPVYCNYSKTVPLTDITGSFSIQSNDYVLTDTTQLTFSETSISGGSSAIYATLHPDCYVIMQTAPTLTYQNRWSIDVDDMAHSSAVIPFTSEVRIDNGYNIAATTTLNGVLLTCGAGVGAGAVQSAPWVDSSGATIPEPPGPVGLRSINGLTGTVTVGGNTNVYVAAVADIPGFEVRQLPDPSSGGQV